MRISCLHINPAEIPLYEQAAPAHVSLAHYVRADLGYRAQGGLTPGLLAEVQVYLRRIAAGSDAALLTGSALTRAALAPSHAADQLLAEDLCRRLIQTPRATADVMFTDMTTHAAIHQTFLETCDPARLTFTALPEAEPCLARADTRGHNALVHEAIAASTADLIALVQPAMAQASGRPDARILTPQTSVFARLAEVRDTSQSASIMAVGA
ncbi:MAG: hypothetical protein AAF245_04380 [Pseudomonadota bacterium]